MEKNKSKKLIVVALVAFAILIVGASYAYLTAQTLTGKMTDINVTSYTTDVLTFTTGDAINLEADQTTFGQDKGSLSGETFAKATLLANNKTNEATDNYYVYFNIENNTFKYTLGEDKPELILTVTGPDGSEVTEIPGLTYKTTVKDRENKSISGFDVTTTNGLITIANNKTISAKPKAEEQYTLKLTFVNYEGDQTANATSTLSAKVMIQKNMIPFHETCNDNTLACHTAKLYTGTQGENGIYYHDASLTNGAGDNSYRYAGASSAVNNYVCFGSSEAPCPADNLYRIIGVFGDRVKLIKSDYATSTLLGTDGDYKQAYTATFNKNYTSNYKGNNLANIAGYTWNYKNNTSINNAWGSNTWSTSLLNKTNLNTNFITNIGTEWANKIDMTTWKVGGNTWSNIGKQPAKTAYQNEVVKPEPGSKSNGETQLNAKIGLMYASDYGFAAAPSAWTAKLENYEDAAIKNVNWMYMGLHEWTISRNADTAYSVIYVSIYGDVNSTSADNEMGVRPVFYLSSSVNYVSGNGSANDPILVN